MRFFSLLMIAASIHSPGNVWCQGEEPRTELASYLAASQANWEAVRQFDVMIRTDTVRDSPLDTGFVETTFERVIFDWDANRFLFAKRGTREFMDGRGLESLRQAILVKDGYARTFRAPGRATRLRPVENRGEVFDRYGVPDVRLTMFLQLGQAQVGLWTKDRHLSFDTFAKQAKTVSRIAGQSDADEFMMRFNNGVGYRWKFDTSKLVPSEGEWNVKNRDLPVRVLGREKYEWDELDGVMLPQQVLGEFWEVEVPTGLSREEAQKRMVPVVTNRDVRFVWISVNDEFADERFDFEQLDSLSNFFTLTDPVTQGVPLLAEPDNQATSGGDISPQSLSP